MSASSGWASLYFLLAAVFGGFFVVNLYLAVISFEFMKRQAWT